jgi:hypothetical protein
MLVVSVSSATFFYGGSTRFTILHCRKVGLYCPEIGFVAQVYILQLEGPRVEGGGPKGCTNCMSSTKPIEGKKGALQMLFVV